MSRPWFVLATVVVGAALVAPAAGTPVQVPKHGGTLVTGRPAFSEPGCLNLFTCNEVDDPALTQTLEGAFEVGPDLVPRPNLVSSVTIGRDPPSLTYHIRPQARWSDGVPVTARDFEFTQQVFARHYEDPEGFYSNVRSTRILDAKTFRVVLRRPFAAWRNLYSMVLPGHALAGQDVTKIWGERVDNPRTGQPIGSGPFLVSRLERGKQIVLVRNPHYWGPHVAYLDGIVERFMTPDPRDPLAQIRDNHVDLGFTLGGGAVISADEAREIQKLPGWRVTAWPVPAIEHFTFRVGPGGHPALRLKLVRQALAYGIDRVAIAREIQQDVPASIRKTTDSTVFLPTEVFYQPTWRRYRYDVARARKLLDQAGCRLGSGGIYECAGERMRLRVVTTAGAPARQRIVELATAELRAVGVEVEPVYAPPNVFLGQILPNGDFDVALFTWGGLTDATRVWPDVLCGDAQNFGGYCSRLVARDAEQNIIGTPEARARVLNHLDAKLANAAPVLPVVQQAFRAYYRSNVHGLVFGGSQFEFGQNSEDWWVAPER
jgi:peptide/nickel transport system substrate-binding protein